MGDARHKRRYFGGKRVVTNREWRALVKKTLEDNLQANREPRNQTELAAMLIDTSITPHVVGVHKTAITSMFRAHSSGLVDEVCRVLKIPHPDEVGEPEIVRVVRSLTPAEQRRWLRMIRADRLDGE